MLQMKFEIKFAFVLVVFCFIFLCNNQVYSKQFEYYNLDLPNYVGKISYTNKKAINILYVKMVNPANVITISSVPYDRLEYDNFLENRKLRLKNFKFIEGPKINHRNLNCIYKKVSDDYCYLMAFDYFKGMSFLYEYTGKCEETSLFFSLLSSFNYDFTEQDAEDARIQFLTLLKDIENLKIPIIQNAYNINRDFIKLGMTTKVNYQIKNFESSKIISFYKNIFEEKRSWKSLTGDLNETIDDRHHYRWVDLNEKIEVNLIILKEKKCNGKNVLITVRPYIKMI